MRGTHIALVGALVFVSLIPVPLQGGEKEMKSIPEYAGGLIATLPGVRSGNLTYNSSSAGLPTAGIWRADLDVGDIDNDGWVDIIHTGPRKPFNTGLYAWENAGGGRRWILHKNSSALVRDGGAVLGDVDMDGKLDVAFGCHGTANLLFFKGHGNFSFSKVSPDPPALPNLTNRGGYIDVDLGDYDNDGDLDLAAATFWGGGIGVWRWENGTWNLTNSSNGLPSGSNEHTYAVLFDDVNSDGKLDLVTSFGNGCCFGYNTWGRWVFLGDGNGTWRNSSRGMEILGDSDGYDVDTADFNNDGKRDIVVISSAGIYYVDVFLGDGTGNWSHSRTLSGYVGYPTVVEAADMDNDGNDDVVLMTYARSGGYPSYIYTPHLYIFKGRGDGNFTRSEINISARGKPYGLDVADVDHNGYLDIIASTGQDSSGYPGGIYVWKNTRPISSTPSVRVLYPRGGETFTAGGIRTIEWTSAGSSRPFSVKLEYSITGPSGPFFTIASNLPDTGKYYWKVPNTPSRNCYVRVTVVDNSLRTASSVSRGSFRIVDSEGRSQRLRVMRPNGGEVFFVGGRITLYFYSLLNASISRPVNVTVEYSFRGPSGPFVKLGTVVMKGRGIFTFNWTVPASHPFSNNSFFRITALDPDLNVTLTDTSDRPFYVLTRYETLRTVEILFEKNVTDVGMNLTFRAVARNVDGGVINHLVSFSWIWPEDLGHPYGGSHGENFTFNATTRGSGNITVIARFLTLFAASTVNISIREALAELQITPKESIKIVGESVDVSVVALNPFGVDITDMVGLKWELNGTSILLNHTGVGSAKAVIISPGYTNITVMATLRNYTAANTSTVCGLPFFSSLTVEPGSLYLKHGVSVELRAFLYDYTRRDVTARFPITWRVEGGAGEMSSSNGSSSTFTATWIGEGRVVATARYLNETLEAVVPVLVRPVIKEVVVSPERISIPRGGAVLIRAEVYDSTGRDIGYEANLTWDTGGDVGHLEWGVNHLSRVFVADSVGEGVVTLSVEWWGDFVKVQIPVEVFYNYTGLTVTPDNATLLPGDFVIFTVKVLTDTNYNIIDHCNLSFQVVWRGEGEGLKAVMASGSRIKVSALYWGEGELRIYAEYRGRNLSATVPITVLPPLIRAEMEGCVKSIYIGDVLRLSVRAYAADGSDITGMCSVVWTWDGTHQIFNFSRNTAVVRGETEGDTTVTVAVTYHGRTIRNSTTFRVLERPVLSKIVIAFSKKMVEVNESVLLEVHLYDRYNQPFTMPFSVQWSASSGVFNNTTAPVVSFTPTHPGDVVITVSVSSPYGSTSANLTVYVEGDVGGEGRREPGGGATLPLWPIVLLAGVAAGIILLFLFRRKGLPPSTEKEDDRTTADSLHPSTPTILHTVETPSGPGEYHPAYSENGFVGTEK